MPQAAFEEGGFGKGIGLDAALAALRAADVRAAVIDLGGQLAVLGAPHGTTLADPRARERAVLALELGPGSFSTSGNSERGILVEGVARGHLLDPRSGEPAPDFGSLSVWAADATAADCLSTGLYVLGPEAALRFAGAHPGIELVLLIPRGERLAAVATEAWRGRLRPLVPDLELVYVDVRSLPPSGPVPALSLR
jgi:thiamine biosynthesis lipoprotein